MPHRCMECKNILESGELDLNTGCPVCGGKKFQYIRAKKETKDKNKEKELRKLTVAEYVSQAAATEARTEKAQEHKEAPKPRAVKAEPGPHVKAGAEPEVKEPKDKKPAHERIESVRILEKGRYDINLPILLNRKELVMSKEEGVYVVDLPSALKTPKKKKR
jgi:predicted  nucleic acid-binding Zn-ribbon protein